MTADLKTIGCGRSWEAYMKRFAAALLTLVFLSASLSGCTLPFLQTAKPSLSADDREAVDTVYTAVRKSRDILTDISDLVEQQIEDSNYYVEHYRKATESGKTYDSTEFDAQILTNKTAIDGYVADVEKYQKQIDKIAGTDSDQAGITVSAAQQYFTRLLSCLSDLHSVMTFYLDETDAAAPIAAYNIDSYGEDVLSAIDGLYTAIDDTIINFRALESCPLYMQETFKNYIDKVGIYQKMLESMYYGLSLNDPLRAYSADELYERQNVVILNCELELFDLIDLQYEKVSERLAGSIKTLQGELLANCGDLTDASSVIPEISYEYLTQEPSVTFDYEVADTIYPNLYSSMDSVINLTATAENGSVEALVEAEIPGFTQKYEQKITITEQVTKLLIKPVILTDNLDLSSSKDAQVRFSVTDINSGKVLVEESKTISLMSIYDFSLSDDEFGIASRENVLAWLTPESDGILELRRNAVSWLETWSGGTVSSLIGYQDYGLFDDYSTNTYLQIVALQAAVSEMGVRYNMGAFSLAEGENQRVLLPDDVLSSQSGICIETAILFAAAIQSTDMHAMILFLPGHAQVAVETWSGSGEYFLVETTLLPFTGTEEEMPSLITEFTNEEWQAYLEDPWGNGSGSVYVVDCDLVKTLGIQGISSYS